MAPVAPAIIAPAPATLEQRLHGFAVGDDDFYRGVLYTWTTPDSIDKARASRQLLVATAGTGTFTSPFNRALAGLVTVSPIAKLLATHPALIRRRYAWPAAFATVMGIGPRTYGNALIRIELSPRAWIGRFDPGAAEPFAFVDAQGARVPTAQVVAEPERIGAIFHVRTEATQAIPFREYVVCSAAMITSWSVATRAIRDELDAELAAIRLMREWSEILPADEAVLPASRAWRSMPAVTSDPATLWRATLAFDNPRYRPHRAPLDALLAELARYDPAGGPVVVSP
ncbi:MAG: hypothetical protein ABI867_02405 [Kofleriaceae bacterium]